MSKTKVIRIFEDDVGLLHRIKAEIGFRTIPDLIHDWCLRYYALESVLPDVQKLNELETEIVKELKKREDDQK